MLQNNFDDVTSGLLKFNREKCFGKYRGKVTNNKDPDHRGCVEVQVHSLFREEKLWAMPCAPFGGNGHGLFMAPEIGANVWVEFEGGDTSLPVVTGYYWPPAESPKDRTSDEPLQRFIKSKKGLLVKMDDDTEVITISDDSNKNLITIDAGGTVTIKGAINIVLDGNVKLGESAASEPGVKAIQLYAYLLKVVAAVNGIAPGSLVPPDNTFFSQKVKLL